MKTIIHTPCPNLKESLSFYNRLGFHVLSEGTTTLVTDGQVTIEINSDRFARAGVKLYREDWKETVEKLQELFAVTTIDNGYLLADPSNTWIYLLEKPGPNFETPDEAIGLLGNFAGLSLETTDMVKSITLWGLLGFKSSGSADQSWVSCTSEDGLVVSLMKPLCCPHLFFNPSLTYFNGKANLSIIGQIRNAGILIAEEITHFNKDGIVDNVIIRDPGGYGFFIFSD